MAPHPLLGHGPLPIRRFPSTSSQKAHIAPPQESPQAAARRGAARRARCGPRKRSPPPQVKVQRGRGGGCPGALAHPPQQEGRHLVARCSDPWGMPGLQDPGIHVHRWRGKHRGMAPVQLRRRRELGIATVRLRKIVAEWRWN